MAQFVSPTTYESKTVFLIGKENLEQLSTILEEIKSLIPSSTSECKKDTYTLTTKENSNFNSKITLTELIKDHQIKQYTPESINIEFNSKDIRFNLKIDTRFNYILYYVSRYENEDLHNKTYTEIKNWIDSLEANIFEKIWSYIIPPISFLITITMILFFISIFSPNSKSDNEINYERQAHILLDEGITEKNISKAIEIILATEFNYKLKNNLELINIQKEYDWKKIFYFTLGYLIVLCLLFFKPIFLIGIGKNEKKYNFLKWWIFIIKIGIPTYILLPFLVNKIS